MSDHVQVSPIPISIISVRIAPMSQPEVAANGSSVLQDHEEQKKEGHVVGACLAVGHKN